ncbi:MAG: HD-GYP domain-containing protein [Thioalkalispiraceae bacterium]|jgi:putative nucleotidyltransferase with HDIG domain
MAISNKVKVDVNDLKPGMYINELDIPWLESPFLFQGFQLNTDDEIEQVKSVCKFVYIDPEQSDHSVKPDLLLLASRTTSGKSSFAGQPIGQSSDGAISGFREHLYRARKIYNNTRHFISKTYEDIKTNHRVNVKTAKGLVSDMTDNITINPHAMQWLTYLKERHEYTLTHSVNVCILALTFGRHLKLDRAELELLGLGALLHDIGKLKVPSEVLDKPGRLSPEEFEIMKTHPVEGHKILKSDEHMPLESLEVVLHHHERINGAGYPDNLHGDHISLITKMSSIVDVYDAITSDRCYHDGISPYKALQNIYSWAKNDFDMQLVEEFMSCMGIYPVGTIVELNDGQTGIVLSATEKTRLRPIVLLIKDNTHKYYKQRKIYNLSSQTWDEKSKRIEIKQVIEPKESDINVRRILEEESLTPKDKLDSTSLEEIFHY